MSWVCRAESQHSNSTIALQSCLLCWVAHHTGHLPILWNISILCQHRHQKYTGQNLQLCSTPIFRDWHLLETQIRSCCVVAGVVDTAFSSLLLCLLIVSFAFCSSLKCFTYIRHYGPTVQRKLFHKCSLLSNSQVPQVPGEDSYFLIHAYTKSGSLKTEPEGKSPCLNNNASVHVPHKKFIGIPGFFRKA